MNIVLCGSYFPDVQHYLRDALTDSGDFHVSIWDGRDNLLPQRIDVLVPLMHRVDAKLMDHARPRLIQQWGSGLEGVDLEAAHQRGIAVANVAAMGGNADSVAEHGILLILALLRRLNEAQENVRSGHHGAPVGIPLAGRTVCIYGLGAIALPLAQRLRAFKVKLIGITSDPQASKVPSFNLDASYSVEQAGEALRQTDILVVCLRQSNDNGGIIGREQLAMLPSGALVVNIARGGLVDYTALLEGLQSGHLGGAGLDVFWKEPADKDDPLLALPNVIVTPHVGGITTSSMADIAKGVAENIQRLRSGAPILNIA